MAKKRPKQRPKKLSVDVVETQSIVLVDDYGTERAAIYCTGGDGGQGGMTVVRINDDSGRPRVEIQVAPDGTPSIRLSTPNDGAGVSMSVNSKSGNGISIGDYKGDTCISMGVDSSDSQNPNGSRPDIVLFDHDKQIAWSAFAGGTFKYKSSSESQ